MDENTFHHELLNLKHQLATMTLSDPTKLCSMFPELDYAHDRFMASLQELKTYTLMLQSNLSLRWKTNNLAKETPCRIRHSFPNASRMTDRCSGTTFTPQCYDQNAHLNDNIQGLSIRTNRIEEKLSVIEGRLDKLELGNRTPSTLGMEDRTCEVQHDEIGLLALFVQEMRRELHESNEKLASKDFIIDNLQRQIMAFGIQPEGLAS